MFCLLGSASPKNTLGERGIAQSNASAKFLSLHLDFTGVLGKKRQSYSIKSSQCFEV